MMSEHLFKLADALQFVDEEMICQAGETLRVEMK